MQPVNYPPFIPLTAIASGLAGVSQGKEMTEAIGTRTQGLRSLAYFPAEIAPPPMPKLAEIVTELRSLLSTELGQTQAGRAAIGVYPDQVLHSPNGLSVIVERVPRQGRESGKVTSGTYHQDMYRIILLNPMQSDAALGASSKLTAAKRKIENRFNAWASDYVGPEDDRPEQAHIDIFEPVID